jgi:20S proteasome alpha/beta subunit
MADVGGGAPHGAGGHESNGNGAPHTGTTIVACAFDGGVVLGADGRVSTGNYISNRASNKIMPLTAHCYLLRSGSAADTQAVGDFGEKEEERRGRRGGRLGTEESHAHTRTP